MPVAVHRLKDTFWSRYSARCIRQRCVEQHLSLFWKFLNDSGLVGLLPRVGACESLRERVCERACSLHMKLLLFSRVYMNIDSYLSPIRTLFHTTLSWVSKRRLNTNFRLSLKLFSFHFWIKNLWYFINPAFTNSFGRNTEKVYVYFCWIPTRKKPTE